MKLEIEITVLVNDNYKNLHQKLLEKGFTIKEEYQINDDYLAEDSIDLSSIDKLSILKGCVLVRDVVNVEKSLLYKYKKIGKSGEILEQGKVKCPISDVNKAMDFMQAINYKRIFTIHDKCIVYSNEKTEIVVQIVNDKYIFIEMEDEAHYIDKKYNNVEEMIKELDSYDLPYEKNNYYVKKAEIILDDIINHN